MLSANVTVSGGQIAPASAVMSVMFDVQLASAR